MIFALTPLSMCALVFIIARCSKRQHHATKANLPAKSWVVKLRGIQFFAETCVPVFLFFLQPSLTLRALEIFACVRLGNDDYYMVRDLSVRCWQQDHVFIIITLGLPMLVLYAVGIPIGVYLWLANAKRRNRLSWPCHQQNLQQSEEKTISRSSSNRIERKAQQLIKYKQLVFRMKYSFLYESFRPDKYWWETVIMLRKTILSFLSVFFQFDYEIQSLIALLVLFAATILQLLNRPYEKDSMNFLEFVSTMCTFLLFFFGQFTYTHNSSDLAKTAAIFGAFVISFVYTFFLVAYYIKLYRLDKLEIQHSALTLDDPWKDVRKDPRFSFSSFVRRMSSRSSLTNLLDTRNSGTHYEGAVELQSKLPKISAIPEKEVDIF